MSSVVVALFAIILATIFWLYRKAYYIHPELAKLPGPPRVPILGSAHHVAGSPFTAWMKIYEKYGDTFFMKLLSKNVICICDPTLIQKVVQMKDVFQRRAYFDTDILLFGKVLFCVDGEDWHTRRMTLNPHFRSQNINALFPVVAERSMKAVKYLRQFADKEVNVDPLFCNLTLDVICHFLLSTHLDATSGEPNIMTKVFEALAPEASIILICPPLYYFPRPAKFNFLKARRALRRFLDAVIDDHRTQPSEHKDVVDVMVDAKLDNHAIKDELVGLLFAGHDTTAHTLSFALYHICKDGEILQKINAEIKTLTCNEKGELVNLEEVSRLKYLTACIKETLRLYPQGNTHPATALEDTYLGEMFVPKGTVVMCQTQIVQRLEKYWPEPLVFKPERFVADDVPITDGIVENETKSTAPQTERKPSTYFPFMQGRHMCIGQHLAMLEMRVVLATLLKHLDFSVKPGYVPEPEQRLTIPPAGGLFLTPTTKG